MRLNYTLTLILTCTLSIIHAADTSDDEVLTFYDSDLLCAANVERQAPIIKHYIAANRRETFSGKTFKTLFYTNACANHIPWFIMTSIMSHKDRHITDYIDVVELIKNNPAEEPYDFSSSESSERIVNALTANAIRKQYPNAILTLVSINPICYKTDSMQFKDREGGHAATCCKDLKGKTYSFNELSCALAISFNHDYSQLIPLLENLSFTIKNSNDSRIKRLSTDRVLFWCETFLALPDEKQKTLLKECKERFGWDLCITRNPS